MNKTIMENLCMADVIPSVAFIFGTDDEIGLSIQNNDLYVWPDPKTVCSFITEAFILRRHPDISFYSSIKHNSIQLIDKFTIDMNMLEDIFTTTWHEDVKPPNFLKFQEEWDRQIKMKAFW